MFLDKVVFSKTKVPVLNGVLNVTQLRQYLLSEIAGQKWGQVDARKKLPFPGERMHTFETFFLKEETSS